MISAYVPAYNSAGTIAATVESLRRQSLPVAEVLVIDDGSTDGTSEQAERAGARVIRFPQNRGRGAARAVAMTEAQLEFVVCCDATNVLAPDFLEKTMPWFETPSVAAVVGRIGQLPPRTAVARWRGRHLFKTHISIEPSHHSTLITFGAVVRKSSVLAAGNFDASMRQGEDAELGQRLAQRGFDIVVEPRAEVQCVTSNTLGQVLERFWRWNNSGCPRLSFIGYLRTLWFSLRVMAPSDLKAGDVGSAMISLLWPHYSLWKDLTAPRVASQPSALPGKQHA